MIELLIETRREPLPLVMKVDDGIAEVIEDYPLSVTRNGRGYMYAYFTFEGVRTSIARWIMQAPKGSQVDHRDRNTLNNQRSNLRICTHQENMQNRGCWSSTGYKGVRPNASRLKAWHAGIKNGGRYKYLGSFATAEDAAHAYDKAALECHGEFAWLNFPENASSLTRESEA